MPEFVARFTPPNAQGFVKGYFEAMEWLAPDLSPDNPEPIEIDEVLGFTAEAIEKVAFQCNLFIAVNSELLGQYAEHYKPARGYNIDECAGHDFYLTRNGHGSGFWDRGNHPCFQALTDAARKTGESEAILGDDNHLHIFP